MKNVEGISKPVRILAALGRRLLVGFIGLGLIHYAYESQLFHLTVVYHR